MRTLVGRGAFGGAIVAVALLAACGDDDDHPGGDGGATGAGTFAGPATTGPGGSGGGADPGSGGASATTTSAGSGSSSSTGTGGAPPLGDEVTVTLTEAAGPTGATIVNFAVPLQAGQLPDPALVRVLAGGEELPAARRALAAHPDGTPRSVQIQVEIDPATTPAVVVELGTSPTAAERALVAVEETLIAPDGIEVPRVWAELPAAWLAASGVAGPLVTTDDVAGDPRLATWATLCDAAAWGSEAFFAEDWESDRGVWLYDRGTTLYRAYARGGGLDALRSAYTETSLYRARITGAGSGARNGVPGGGDDPKYTYAQNLAIHHLLTGDDRHREAAEAMALAMAELWPSPEYAGGTDEQWTERNQGFALLATTWAAMVSDDRADELEAAADAIVDATLDVQATYPIGWDDPDHRCFAHHGDAHDPDEGNPYFGCSPWMSAILADGLDAHARLVGGERADEVRTSLVQLGRIVARDGIGPEDRPHYWMGVGTDQDAPDDYDEHVGESAYLIALARAIVGAPDAELDGALDTLLAKLAADGTVGQIRSFNWQCRTAVMTPTFVP